MSKIHDYLNSPEVKKMLQRARLGDKVERVTKAFGIKPCKGCLKRKKILNGEY